MKNTSERDKARETLREMVKPGMTVYTLLRHRSRSGMFRLIDLQVIEDNEPRWIGYTAATATSFKYDRERDGLRVSGCGMDMGFHVVYELSHALYPDGFGCIGNKCPSNDHSNGDRDYTLDGIMRVGHTCSKAQRSSDVVCSPENCVETVLHWHRDGGYALRHRWL